VGSIVVDVIGLGILQMVDVPLAGGFPVQRVVAAALLNTVIGAIAILPARMLLARTGAAEKGAW
jgi:hypothetical protein